MAVAPAVSAMRASASLAQAAVVFEGGADGLFLDADEAGGEFLPVFGGEAEFLEDVFLPVFAVVGEVAVEAGFDLGGLGGDSVGVEHGAGPGVLAELVDGGDDIEGGADGVRAELRGIGFIRDDQGNHGAHEMVREGLGGEVGDVGFPAGGIGGQGGKCGVDGGVAAIAGAGVDDGANEVAGFGQRILRGGAADEFDDRVAAGGHVGINFGEGSGQGRGGRRGGRG